MSNDVIFDLNRMKKTYPLIRRKPKLSVIGTASDVELSHIIFSDSSSETYTFTSEHIVLPICIVTPEQDNVNTYISSLSLTSVTISSSYNFTGKVHIHVYKDIGD